MADSPPASDPGLYSEPQARSSNRRFTIALALMAAAFLVVLLQRNRIRCEWWARQLAAAASPADQSYYVSCLISCGDDAMPAIRRLIRDPRAEVRAVALVLLGRRPANAIVADIAPLLHDPDRDIRESAGMTLAFTAAPAAIDLLRDTAVAPREDVACAALAALGRTGDPAALASLCDALARRPQPLVRAQAAESLAEMIAPAPGARPALAIPTDTCDPVEVLIRALGDGEPFDGVLSTERQIAQIAAHVSRQTTQPVSRPDGRPPSRTVAVVAAEGLTRLTGTDWPATPALDQEVATARAWELIRERQ